MIKRHEPEEVLNILKTTECPRKAYERILMAAQNGNVSASYEIAQLLMKGGWDLRAMQDDLLMDKLIPAPADINQDPYLVVKRDPIQALVYCRQVAEYDKTSGAMVNMHKAFCQQAIKAFDPASDPANNAFLKAPYRRPEKMKNSVESLFYYSAFLNMIFNVVGWLLVVGFAFNFTILAISGGPCEEVPVCLLSILAVAIILPLLSAGFVFYFYGMTKHRPVCSCKNIRSAFSKTVARLPETFAATMSDPFTDTQWIIRNAVSCFFWYSCAGLVISALAVVITLNSSKVKFSTMYSEIASCLFFLYYMFSLKQINGNDRACTVLLEQQNVTIIAHSA